MPPVPVKKAGSAPSSEPSVRREILGSSSCYLGIDPGASGALVLLEGKHPVCWKLSSMTPQDLWCLLNDEVAPRIQDSQGFAVIEKVGGYVAGNPAPGSRMFNFGMGYGMLRMALVAAGIPHEEVLPKQWQKGLRIPPRRTGRAKGRSIHAPESPTQWKSRLKAFAQSLFLSENVTGATADALLIAEYCRRWREGLLR